LVHPMTDLYADLRNRRQPNGGIFGSEYEPADVTARRFHVARGLIPRAASEPKRVVAGVAGEGEVIRAREVGVGGVVPAAPNTAGVRCSGNSVTLVLPFPDISAHVIDSCVARG
jgi:hypothetical protein